MAGLDAERGGRASRDASEQGTGFDGQLHCASLADLIQLQCSNRARVGVAVRSKTREGHLFFDNGQMVHAVAGRLVGEDAVFDMLEWNTGTFSESSEAWPAKVTISSSWQQVLLSAAQRRDERQPAFPASSTARLVAVKRPASSLPSGPTGELADAPYDSIQRDSDRAHSASSRPRESVFQLDNGLNGLICAARFDDAGNLLEMRGDAHELTALAVYLRRFADLLGECAGQEGFRSFECRSGGTDLALFVDAPGSYVIVSTTDLSELRRFYRPSTSS
jgi:hypothetical protein